eukprot:scaffold10560_cov133-Isochrysis_galbana.AAC.26
MRRTTPGWRGMSSQEASSKLAWRHFAAGATGGWTATKLDGAAATHGFSLSPTKMGLIPPLEVGVEETDII